MAGANKESHTCEMDMDQVEGVEPTISLTTVFPF